MKLNIGCGHDKREGYINLDKEPGVGDFTFDLNTIPFKELPWDDNTFEEIYASHIIEHLSHPLDIFEELWRVAKPDCKLIVRVPYGSSDNAWEDPTHVRPYFLQSFAYFSQCAYGKADYGYLGDWQMTDRKLVIGDRFSVDEWATRLPDLLEIVTYNRNIVEEFICEMVAVKPRRAAGTTSPGVPISFEFKKA